MLNGTSRASGTASPRPAAATPPPDEPALTPARPAITRILAVLALSAVLVSCDLSDDEAAKPTGPPLYACSVPSGLPDAMTTTDRRTLAAPIDAWFASPDGQKAAALWQDLESGKVSRTDRAADEALAEKLTADLAALKDVPPIPDGAAQGFFCSAQRQLADGIPPMGTGPVTSHYTSEESRLDDADKGLFHALDQLDRICGVGDWVDDHVLSGMPALRKLCMPHS